MISTQVRHELGFGRTKIRFQYFTLVIVTFCPRPNLARALAERICPFVHARGVPRARRPRPSSEMRRLEMPADTSFDALQSRSTLHRKSQPTWQASPLPGRRVAFLVIGQRFATCCRRSGHRNPRCRRTKAARRKLRERGRKNTASRTTTDVLLRRCWHGDRECCVS